MGFVHPHGHDQPGGGGERGHDPDRGGNAEGVGEQPGGQGADGEATVAPEPVDPDRSGSPDWVGGFRAADRGAEADPVLPSTLWIC